MPDLFDLELSVSADVVTDFLYFALASILYQRNIFPESLFHQKHAFGVSLVAINNTNLHNSVCTMLTEVRKWLLAGDLQSLFLVIRHSASNVVVEKWKLNVSVDGSANPSANQTDYAKQIKTIIKQIVSCVTFLPTLEGEFLYEIEAVTRKTPPPLGWRRAESDSVFAGESLELRELQTAVYKVGTNVEFVSPLAC